MGEEWCKERCADMTLGDQTDWHTQEVSSHMLIISLIARFPPQSLMTHFLDPLFFPSLFRVAEREPGDIIILEKTPASSA